MEQEEMAALQGKAGVDNSGGVTKLAQEIAEKLAQLKSFVDSSEATTDKDRMQMDSLMQNFVSVVEKQLGAAPGEDQEEEQETMNQVPMQAGMKGMPMGPQTRQ
jgi:hypothetical protein